MSMILPDPVGTGSFPVDTVINPIIYGDGSGYFSSNGSDWCGSSAFGVTVCSPPYEPPPTPVYNYYVAAYTPPLEPSPVSITPEPSLDAIMIMMVVSMAFIRRAWR